MNGDIQSTIASSYASQFNYPINISMIDKLTNWKSIQTLSYSAIKTHIKDDFHGVKDMYKQLAAYSATHPILQKAWSVIVGLVLTNGQVLESMFTDSIMGSVGKPLQSITNFGQVFGITPGEITDPASIVSKAKSATLSV